MTIQNLARPRGNDIDQVEHFAAADAKRVVIASADGSGNGVDVTTDGQLHVVMSGKNDDNNSTDTPLDGDATWTGTATDVSNYAGIAVIVNPDQDSATKGLVIEFSPDNSHWYSTESYTIEANAEKVFTPPRFSKYFRVKYTNGSTPQSAFHVHTFLSKLPFKWSSHNLQDDLNDEDDGMLMVGVTKLRTAQDTYVSMSSTAQGNAKISLEEFEESGFTNGLPVRMGDSFSIDAFARQRMSSPYTLFDSKQISDQHLPLYWDDQEVSGGSTTSTWLTNRASTVLGVGATTAGKRVRQTKQRWNYQPGKSQLYFITFSDIESVTGISKCSGAFDDQNGLFLKHSDGVASFVRRTYATGSAVDTTVTQANWNLDTMDGNGDSGITLDFSKSQILIMDFEWLGVGRVRMGFVIDGKIYYAHQFLNANNLDVVYMSRPNLPIRYEIENDGTGAADTFETICCSVISEGGFDPNGVVRGIGSATSPVNANTAGTTYAILGIRLKSDCLCAAVFIDEVELLLTSAITPGRWSLILNPTVAGTFTYSDITNSVLQLANGDVAGNHSTNTVTGGTVIHTGLTSANTSDSGMPKSAIKLGATISGTPDEIVLCFTPFAANADVYGSINVREVI